MLKNNHHLLSRLSHTRSHHHRRRTVFAAIVAAMIVPVTGSCSLLKSLGTGSSGSTAESSSMPMSATAPHPSAVTISTTDISGHWYVQSIGAMHLSDYEDNWPYVEFVPDEGRFYGFNGCNVINGSYAIENTQPATHRISLSEISQTMRLCPSDSVDYPMSKALENTASFAVAGSRNGSVELTLKDATGNAVMTLRKSDIDFLNGAWRVTAVDGHALGHDSAARLVIDINECTLQGNTGCNNVSGELMRDPLIASSVQFIDLRSTRLTCPDIATESALLIALEEVCMARHDSNGKTVTLLSKNGDELVKLSPLSKSDVRQAN
jgi:heat shock protein HslJ